MHTYQKDKIHRAGEVRHCKKHKQERIGLLHLPLSSMLQVCTPHRSHFLKAAERNIAVWRSQGTKHLYQRLSDAY
jgi:hypothetical protein